LSNYIKGAKGADQMSQEWQPLVSPSAQNTLDELVLDVLKLYREIKVFIYHSADVIK
jgi:hypothetical protein